MISMYVLVAAVLLLILNLTCAEIKKATLSRKTWQELIAELGPVMTEGITLAALECADIRESEPMIDPRDLWTMVGGWEGLKQMHTNAGLLIAVAAHAQDWSPQQSIRATDRMRQDGLAVRRAAVSIKLKHVCGFGARRQAVHVQEFAAAYYRMTECVLNLYETSPSRRYEQLSLAVWPYSNTSNVATR